MNRCDACWVGGAGDLSMGTVGATASVKRAGKWWLWHVHSLATQFNHDEGYTIDGRERSKFEALRAAQNVCNIAAVAWYSGHPEPRTT